MENQYGIIELVLVFAILLGLLGYELRSVRREINKDSVAHRETTRPSDHERPRY